MSDAALHPGGNSTISPSFANESNTGAILSGLGVLTFFATLFVVLRVYVRACIIKQFGADDYISIVALLCCLGGYATFAAQGFYGLGRHNVTISSSDLITFQKIQFAQTIMSAMVGPCALKISVALMLRRYTTKKWYRNSLLGVILFMSAYTVASIFMIVLQCIPTAGFWDPNIKKTATCYPFPIFLAWGQASTALNITTDIVLSTLPIPLIWQLQLKQRVKFWLIGILSLAYCATGAGIAKLIFQAAYTTAPDKIFHQSLQFCGFIELALGIIAANAPTLKPLCKTVLGLGSTDYGISTGQRYAVYGKHRSSVNPYVRQLDAEGSDSDAIDLVRFSATPGPAVSSRGSSGLKVLISERTNLKSRS